MKCMKYFQHKWVKFKWINFLQNPKLFNTKITHRNVFDTKIYWSMVGIYDGLEKIIFHLDLVDSYLICFVACLFHFVILLKYNDCKK